MKAHERFPLLPIARGEGAWLIDFEGRRYLDGVSSWWVNLFGHSNFEINTALLDQMGKLEHVMLAGFTHEPAVALAEQLSALAPGRLGHAFFASDGASAAEIALKMAFHYWANRGRPGKKRFVALAGGYHGETIGALSVTDVAIFRDAYGPLLRENILVPFPGDAGAIEALEKVLAEHSGEIAALIVEPLVQGASGMRMYPSAYLKRARELCTKREVLLIADEIMTGFGRTGSMFACEQAGIAPDLLCLSKGITGGYLPLSCVLSSDEVYAAFYDDDVTRGFLHSHSYTGNALACRAALAVLDIFKRDHVIDANRERAARLSEAAHDALAKHRNVRNLRNLGMIWAFEVESADPQFARKAFELALRRGVLLRPIGKTVYFMPPYIVSEAEFDLLVDAGVAIADAA
ncbi:Adenosylmethionine-8-amino-7-oxononanoate aminotransferase [Usitatibacter palustris]|uniref:Adenosylmethionine-8-amino-7-oxononanoate aminotransferase n=2 Tax=Usitatibacter palustris TaxID=2732487 RepID=A0A6M4HAY5_9PROT|nr:Adenosylmethionine-8-amino-7-oxononanoate aminotransferase [Usitatibacter palustris]